MSNSSACIFRYVELYEGIDEKNILSSAMQTSLGLNALRTDGAFDQVGTWIQMMRSNYRQTLGTMVNP